MAGSGARRAGRGLSTLEMAVVLPVVLALLLATLDAVNLYRTQRAVDEAARQAARAAAHAGIAGGQAALDEAAESARREISAILPPAVYDCAGDPEAAHCTVLMLQPVGQTDESLEASISYRLPLFVLPDSPRKLEGRASVRIERTYVPAVPPAIKHSHDWEE